MNLSRRIAENLRAVVAGIELRVLCRLLMFKTNTSRVLIVVDCFGRLGNRLTVWANLLCYAGRVNGLVIDLAFMETLKSRPFPEHCEVEGTVVFFERPLQFSRVERWLLRRLKSRRKLLEATSFQSARGRVLGVTMVRGSQTHRIVLGEWPELLRGHVVLFAGLDFEVPSPTLDERAKIREMLRVRECTDLRIQRSLEDGEATSQLIGVHVRHGDYHYFLGGKYYFELPVYLDHLVKLQDMFHGPVRFYVVSDAVLHQSDFEGLQDVKVVTSDEEHDLFLLSRCKFIVGTYSTFLFWASFYGDAPMYLLSRTLSGAKLMSLPPVCFPRFSLVDMTPGKIDE